MDSGKIFELGHYVSKFLTDNGLNGENNLVISVNKEELKKIDEDLYYRNKPDGKEEFTPSDNDILVKFENLTVIFTTDEAQNEQSK